MEAKIIFAIVALFVGFASCGDIGASNIDSRSKSVEADGPFLLKHDSVYCKIQYQNADSSFYRVTWGNTTFFNKTKAFEIFGNGHLQLKGYNKEAIVLTQGCGTSCTYNVVLPLKKNAVELTYMFVKALDIANGLVAYIPEEDSVFIRIENIYTGDHMNILEKNICSAAFKGDCIDTSFFDSGDYIYTLNGSNWTIHASEIIRKEVHVELY